MNKGNQNLGSFIPLIVLLICGGLMCVNMNAHAQARMGTKKKFRHQLAAGPLVSFYKGDPNFSTNIKSNIGFIGNYTLEKIRKTNTNHTLGVSYVNQKLSFNGYFADSGHTYLYDDTFPYAHEIIIQELRVPLGVKVYFGNNIRTPTRAYYLGGAGARIIFKSYNVIINDSTETSAYEGPGDIDFENKSVNKNINTFIFSGLGLQYTNRESGRSAFFQINFSYGIARLNYHGDGNSNEDYFKNNTLTFLVGIIL